MTSNTAETAENRTTQVQIHSLGNKFPTLATQSLGDQATHASKNTLLTLATKTGLALKIRVRSTQYSYSTTAKNLAEVDCPRIVAAVLSLRQSLARRDNPQRKFPGFTQRDFIVLRGFVVLGFSFDTSIPALQDRTPLQATATPSFDLLASNGVTGLMDPVEPGLACGSDTAHMNIFGYNPRVHYRGRGCFESMGAGLHMEIGDIAFKSNFATWEPESGIVLSRRADRNFEELGPVLCAHLDGMKLPSFPEHEIAVKYATEHRCAVRVRGPGLTDDITGTDPLKDNLPLVKCEPTTDAQEAAFTSALVNELSFEIYKRLNDHPINAERRAKGKAVANCVLLRGCGVRINVPTFEQLHNLHSFMIAPTAIIAGLGMCIGLDIVKVPGATGDYHTDIDAKGRAVVENIVKDEYQFGFCHIKAVDDAGHDRNVGIKTDFLKRIDTMVGEVAKKLATAEKGEFLIVVTGDHSTPVLSGDHSYEPVPILLSLVGSKVNLAHEFSDRVAAFDEVSCSRGALGRFTAGELMPTIKALLQYVPAK